MIEKKSTKDLAKHLCNSFIMSKKLIEFPSIELLTEIFDVMFYASMQTEEGQAIKVSITYINPNEPADPNRDARKWTLAKFLDPIELNVKSLVKLAKAADPWSSSLAVFCKQRK